MLDFLDDIDNMELLPLLMYQSLPERERIFGFMYYPESPSLFLCSGATHVGDRVYAKGASSQLFAITKWDSDGLNVISLRSEEAIRCDLYPLVRFYTLSQMVSLPDSPLSIEQASHLLLYAHRDTYAPMGMTKAFEAAEGRVVAMRAGFAPAQ
jgi:hypothetical protein